MDPLDAMDPALVLGAQPAASSVGPMVSNPTNSDMASQIKRQAQMKQVMHA